MSIPMKPPKELHTTKPVRFIFAGGFLGSGKTTALAGIAQRLVQRNMRVGIITNDQTVNLVDTAIVKQMLQELDVPVAEVAGGCFCCRFDDLVNVTEQVLAAVHEVTAERSEPVHEVTTERSEHNPDILLGESVGSCTDFAATVARPFTAFYGESFQIAPFSVLTDPQRVRELLFGETATRLPNDVIYLYRKQLEEADIIVLNKVDLMKHGETERLINTLKEQFPDKLVLAVSAKEGAGMDEWLEMLMTPAPSGGRRTLTELDYDRYAAAEAELGWLNATAQLKKNQPFLARAFVQRLMTQLHDAIKVKDAEIAHLKFMITSKGKKMTAKPTSFGLWANLTKTGGEPTYGGSERGESGCTTAFISTLRNAMLIINARVRIAPDELERLVRAALETTANEMGIEACVSELQAFRPAYPRPPYRITTSAPRIVISSSFPSSSDKEKIEEELAEKLVAQGLNTVVMPDIYQLAPDTESLAFLRELNEPIVFFSWLQPRASFWTLARLEVKGKMAQAFGAEFSRLQERPIVAFNLSERCYCCTEGTDWAEKVKNLFGGKLKEEGDSLKRLDDSAVAPHLNVGERRYQVSKYCRCSRWHECVEFCLCPDRWVEEVKNLFDGKLPEGGGTLERFEDSPSERWYPVIDYNRCNGCLECLEFCLFGVYETDEEGNVVVMNPEACKPGCPACSRVCPEEAIIFPLYYEDAAIAGADGAVIKPFDSSFVEELRENYEQGKMTVEDIVRACSCKPKSSSLSTSETPYSKSTRKDEDYFDNLIERLAKE